MMSALLTYTTPVKKVTATDGSELNIETAGGRYLITRILPTTWGYLAERADNWEELEEEAQSIIKQMETPISGLLHPCPSSLASRAAFGPEHSDWISLAEARRVSGRGYSDISQAIKQWSLDLKVRVDQRADGSRSRGRRMVRRSQVERLWPRKPHVTQWLGSRLSELKERLIAEGAGEAAILELRFWDKVDAGRSHMCWRWKGARSGSGYGSFWMKGRSRTAHRVAFELRNGPIPEGMHVRRSCGSYLCVNPSHMVLTEGKARSTKS
jgi:hypothetical protein